jgi:hypothetical protein
MTIDVSDYTASHANMVLTKLRRTKDSRFSSAVLNRSSSVTLGTRLRAR